MPIDTPCELVIFDMDGTLTRPNIDFAAIRSAIGLPDEPILEALSRMSDVDRRRAETILQDFEDVAASTSELQDGAAEIIDAIRAAGRRSALMTRNTARSVELVLSRHRLKFDHIRTREHGRIKPHPEPVLDICRAFSVAPQATWVLGDYHYDLDCANAAGAVSVHFAADYAEMPDWGSRARHIVKTLAEFAELIGIATEGPILPVTAPIADRGSGFASA